MGDLANSYLYREICRPGTFHTTVRLNASLGLSGVCACIHIQLTSLMPWFLQQHWQVEKVDCHDSSMVFSLKHCQRSTYYILMDGVWVGRYHLAFPYLPHSILHFHRRLLSWRSTPIE